MKNHESICTGRPARQENRFYADTFGPFGDPDKRQRCGRDARCPACRKRDPSYGSPAPRACGCPFDDATGRALAPAVCNLCRWGLGFGPCGSIYCTVCQA